MLVSPFTCLFVVEALELELNRRRRKIVFFFNLVGGIVMILNDNGIDVLACMFLCFIYL